MKKSDFILGYITVWITYILVYFVFVGFLALLQYLFNTDLDIYLIALIVFTIQICNTAAKRIVREVKEK
ncbi:hypothetical protein [Mammaliicoccus sciuri]|uniref:hypothetical protein n=1 Tax=Mammaliicoccus sciuri TaxID=1296 RepID=UPI002DBA07F2|nr:hypothetical protein [Mammaliicoccus sciuri]MEB6232492.1 hypothetical protein [Mammaliicoccus sciuri]